MLQVMPKQGQHASVLVAQLEFQDAILRGLKTGRGSEHSAKRGVFSRCQRRKHGPLRDQLILHLFQTLQDLDASRDLVFLQTHDGRVQLVQSQLEPELGHLVLDNEQHLVVMRGLAERPLGTEELVQLQQRLVPRLPGRFEIGLSIGLAMRLARLFCH